MNRNSVIALGAFLLLLGLVAYWSQEEDPAPPPAVEIPGFLDDPGGAVRDPYHLTSDFTRVEITRLGEEIVLIKRGDQWEMVTPVKADVDQGKIRAMFLPLQTPSKSVITKSATDEDLSLYGLDPAHAVSVALYRDDKLFSSFEVGAKEERRTPGGEGVLVDTWVLFRDKDTIARMEGKNIHDPFQLRTRDLRTRRLFQFEPETIVRVEMTHRSAEDLPTISIRRDQNTRGRWVIESPEGYEPGGIKGLLTAITGLEAVDYASLASEEEKGLGPTDDFCLTKVTLNTGKEIHILLGNKMGDNIYARVTDVEGDILLSQYTAKHLHRTIDDLRQKKVLGMNRATLSRITLENDAIILERKNDGWEMIQPKGLLINQESIQDLLQDIETWTITRFAPLEELDARGLTPNHKPTRVTISDTNQTTVLLIGPIRNKVHWAMREGGTKEMWTLTAFMANRFRDRSPEDFRHRKVFGLKRDDIAWVELVHPDETVRVERNPDASGNQGQWVVIRDDERIEKPRPQEVNHLATSLASLVIKSFSSEKNIDDIGLGEEAFRAHFGLRDGARHTVIISEKEPFNNQVFARVPSQAAWAGDVFTINKFQARNIRKKFKHFKP